MTPRPDFAARAAKLGFDFANCEGGSYWNESAAYEFTATQIDELEAGVAEIERLCMIAVDHAVAHDAHELLGISPTLWPLVVQSHRARAPSLYGRMDLWWDGASPPKLLEYNADTPTALLEASVIQWDWLMQMRPGDDQFNSLHEALIAHWPVIAAYHLKGGAPLHFTCMNGQPEDRGTVDYLRDTALQAGLDAPFVAIGDIGWDRRRLVFCDMAERPITALFKLYPWDWLMRDEFGAHVMTASTGWVEPAWRAILSSKGILALLWQLFPGHPNLLPAARDAAMLSGQLIQKPLWGREGANIVAPGVATGGPYGGGGVVYQQWYPLPCVDGYYPVCGAWVIGGRPHGLGIREDATPITRDGSAFVPHFFREGT